MPCIYKTNLSSKYKTIVPLQHRAILEHPLIPQTHTSSSKPAQKSPTPPIPQLGRLTLPRPCKIQNSQQGSCSKWLTPYLKPSEAFVLKRLTGFERSMEHPLVPQRDLNSSTIVQKSPTRATSELGRLTLAKFSARFPFKKAEILR